MKSCSSPGAWGYIRLLRLPAPTGQLAQLPAHGGSLVSDNSVITALAAIAGTGLLAGILIPVPRVSPLAAGLPGLLLLGWTALYLVSPLFVPSRRRVRAEAADPAAAASDYVSSLAEPATSPALAALPERTPTPTAPVGVPSASPWPTASPVPSRESELAW